MYNGSGNWSSGMGQQNEASAFYVLERQTGKLAEMINFTLKTGEERAFPVMAMDDISYLPGRGIVLYSRHATIHIKGRNLQALHRHLAMRKVRQINEIVTADESNEGLWIGRIRIESDYDDQELG